MDIDEIRRANIRQLEQIAGSKTAAADRVGMTYAQYLNYRNGAREQKTGKTRGMRKETAWRFEDAFGKPRGWLDTNHSQPPTACEQPSTAYTLPKRHTRPLVQQLIELAEQVDDDGINQLLGFARALTSTHPLVRANARSST